MSHVRRRSVAAHALALAVCVVALAACSKDEPTKPLPVDTTAPNFTLVDVNANSASYGQHVSPRAQVGNISAWYFGHAT